MHLLWKIEALLKHFGGICFLHVRKIKSGVLLPPPLFPKGGREGPSSASKGKKTKNEKDSFLRALFPALNMRNNFSRGVQSICDSGGEDVLFA